MASPDRTPPAAGPSLGAPELWEPCASAFGASLIDLGLARRALGRARALGLAPWILLALALGGLGLAFLGSGPKPYHAIGLLLAAGLCGASLWLRLSARAALRRALARLPELAALNPKLRESAALEAALARPDLADEEEFLLMNLRRLAA